MLANIFKYLTTTKSDKENISLEMSNSYGNYIHTLILLTILCANISLFSKEILDVNANLSGSICINKTNILFKIKLY